MNDLQTLFTAMFGIYFATTVSTSGKYYAFDSSAISHGDMRALLRLLVGLLLLNVIPFLYFMLVLRDLKVETTLLSQSWSEPLGVLFASLGQFGLYRLFLAMMLIKRKDGRHLFYSHPDELSGTLATYAASRQPPTEAVVAPTNVFVSAIGWVAVCVFLYAILV